ncbi:TPA: ead/Ea22-like family protein [Escherichia coli]|nr:ead/Ea22-like family protein [Escherichia coli]
MSNIDKQALRLAAKNATHGDWKFARSGFNAVVQSPAVLPRGGNALVVVCKLFRSEWRGELKTSQDAAFIAAANPAAVLSLLDELEAKDKQIDDLKATAAHSNAGWKEAHEQEARAEAAEKRNERALSLLSDATPENVWDVIGRLKVVISGDYRSETEIAAAGKGD